MAKYMTQKMSSGKCIPITYYRKQTQAHPNHTETGDFTQDAKKNYAEFNHLNEGQVEEGTYKSNQGIPKSGKTYEI